MASHSPSPLNVGLSGLSHTLQKHAASSTINADIAIKKPPEWAVFLCVKPNNLFVYLLVSVFVDLNKLPPGGRPSCSAVFTRRICLNGACSARWLSQRMAGWTFNRCRSIQISHRCYGIAREVRMTFFCTKHVSHETLSC